MANNDFFNDNQQSVNYVGWNLHEPLGTHYHEMAFKFKGLRSEYCKERKDRIKMARLTIENANTTEFS